MLVLNLAISDFIIVFKCPLAAFNNYMHGPILGDWGKSYCIQFDLYRSLVSLQVAVYMDLLVA